MSKKVEFYKNGAFIKSLSTGNFWVNPNPNDPFRIGISPWDDNFARYTGDLDEVKIYNEVITLEKVQSLYSYSCPLLDGPIYVDSTAMGHNTGLTWTDAYTDLQEAIDLSCNCPDADIWVAKGTYHPTQDNPDSDDNTERDVTFYIDNPAKIYGGFDGDEMERDQRDSLSEGTILTAAMPNSTDTAYHVKYMRADSITSDWVIDGLVIRDGRADGSGDNRNGGGLYAKADDGDMKAIISNCTFSNNSVQQSGGGMFARADAEAAAADATNSPILTNCTFSNNSAQLSGGGCSPEPTSEPSPTLLLRRTHRPWPIVSCGVIMRLQQEKIYG